MPPAGDRPGRWTPSRWFRHDGVHLDPEHLPWLLARCRPLSLVEGRERIPFLSGARVPYYVLVGRKEA